jgi:hypothetical protein
VSDYFSTALACSIPQLVFLEHVRARPTYDVASFQVAVAEHSSESGVAATVGFEAKVLPGGEIDIPPEVLELAPVVGVAEHRWVGSAETLVLDLQRAFSHLREQMPDTPIVWVHPGSWFRRAGIVDRGMLDEVFAFALSHEVLIERNLKYDLVDEETARWVPPAQLIVGLDAHSTDEAVERAREAGVGCVSPS